MKFNVGDIVQITNHYAAGSTNTSDEVWRGKVGRVTENDNGPVYPYSVEVFVPNGFNDRTVLKNIKASELLLLEPSVRGFIPGDAVQLDDGWYVDKVISNKSVEITHPSLEGSIRIASGYLHRVD